MPRRPRGGPPPGERPPQEAGTPSEEALSIGERRDEGANDELIMEIEARVQTIRRTLEYEIKIFESNLPKTEVDYSVVVAKFSVLRDFREAITRYFVLGRKQAGDYGLKKFHELLSFARQLRKIAPLSPENQRIIDSHFAPNEEFLRLPADVFTPVTSLDKEAWDKIYRRESVVVQETVNQLAVAIAAIRVHELAIHGKITPYMAGLFGAFRPISTMNIIRGLDPNRREHKGDAFSLVEVYFPRNVGYEQKKIEVGALQAYDRPIRRYVQLTPELAQLRNEREQAWESLLALKKSKDALPEEWIYSSAALPVVEKYRKFYEDVLQFVVDKILKEETFWGDAEGKPLKKE